MKKFALLLFMLNVSFLFAQKEISGIVIDNAGVALSGANITEKEQTTAFLPISTGLTGLMSKKELF